MAAIHPYLDSSGRDDVLTGGVQRIPITTSKGEFSVWTKRFGNNPDARLLLLHGGPGATHEYFEPCDTHLPAAGIEYYYYDQLGSHYSDQPNEPELWEIDRFVDELEQVRIALGLDASNFFLLGHSWGGVLAIEYALRYQQRIKGLVISNMMSSIPAYNDYAEKVLMPPMDQVKLAKIKAFEAANETSNPEYEALLMEQHYVHHVLRMPVEEWPDPVTRAFAHINPDIYVPIQGPSELGASGKLLHWDRTADLAKILTPALVLGGEHDTMDPRYMEHMASLMPNGQAFICPQGSHMAMFDDQAAYFAALTGFILDLA
jgi:proline iminopeptidase